MTRPAALALKDVSRHFGDREVIGGVTLSVAPHETVAVLGANGAGKTTLLRLAATLLRPTHGHVQVAGHDPRRQPSAARAALAYVGQDAPCYDALTPHEHLVWWARLHRCPSSPGAAATDLAEAGLGAVAHRAARTLSRGQRQRLALAMALHVHAGLLVLDEPYTALDVQGRTWLTTRLQERRGRAATLMAVHEDPEARRLAHRVLRVADGTVREETP